MIKAFRNIVIICSILISQNVYCQGFDQEIISIGDLNLTVGQAFKISELPLTYDSIFSIPPLAYSVLPKLAVLNFETEKIEPAKLKIMEPLTKLYKGYVKAGVGSYLNPLLELSYSSARSRFWNYGGSFNHFSSKTGVKDADHESYSNNEAGLWVKRMIQNRNISFDLNYDRDKFHYYALDPEVYDVEEEAIEQRYSYINGKINYGTTYQDSVKFRHAFAVEIGHLDDLYQTSEDNFIVSGEASQPYLDYLFGVKAKIDADVYNSLLNQPFAFYTDSIPAKKAFKQNNTLVQIQPSISANPKPLKVDVGLDFVFDFDNKSSAHIYPRARVELAILNDQFKLYGNFEGRKQRTTFRKLSLENPYVLPQLNLINTDVKQELTAGLSGKIDNHTSFHIKAGLDKFENLPLFLGDTLFGPENRFDVIYDGGNSQFLSGQITYQQSDKLTIISELNLRNYSMDTQEKVWHIPSATFDLGIIYDLEDKLIGRLDVIYLGKRYALSYFESDNGVLLDDGNYRVPVKGYFDLNIGVEYRYTKRLSAFIQIDNITGGRYQRFYNYRTQPGMILGGIAYSF